MSRKIGALWLKETKDGKKYMSGVLEDLRGNIKIAVFKNDRKESDKHPDYSILLSEEREERKPQTQSGYDPMMDMAGAPQTQDTGEVDVSQIPF